MASRSKVKEEINAESFEKTFDSPLLCKYLDVFLHNKKISDQAQDTRTLLYRGQSDKSYPLNPSVFRQSLLQSEHTLIQELALKAPDDFANIKSPFEKLVKMQHYGLPTRLLDVTTNPLVALYFACSENVNKDGEIFIFYEYMLRPTDPKVLSLAALTEYNGSSERQMLGFLTDNGIKNPELGELTNTSYISVEVPMNNERIKRQHGAFVIVGIRGDDTGNPYQKASFNLKNILNTKKLDEMQHSLVIPKEEKHDLLKELDTIGINRAFLFPELEYQAAYIRQKHMIPDPINVQRISSKSYDVEGFGAGSGDNEKYEYTCPCGNGKIYEEHDNIPGFRNHDVWLDCPECKLKYEINTANGIRNWTIREKK